MSDEEYDKGINKKAIVIVALPVCLVVLFLVLFFTIFNESETTETPLNTSNIESNVEITDAEKLEVEGLAESYVKEAGTFGVREENLTSENIDEMATLLETDSSSAVNYFTPRSMVYEGLDQFIYEGSPIYYPPSTVESWSDEFEVSSRASFSVESIEANSENTGSYVRVNGENMRSVSVNVAFKTNEKMFIEQGSEIGAERSYSIMEKTFDNTAVFVFVYDNHEGEDESHDHSGSDWKLYNIKNLQNEFVLASWNDPNISDFAESQFGFVETGKIAPSNQNIDPALPAEEE